MGAYNCYGKRGIQLKVGLCECKSYKIGDKVKGIKDGVYLGYEGIVVIKNRVFVAEFTEIHDKWGSIINLESILLPRNPIKQIIDKIFQAEKEKR